MKKLLIGSLAAVMATTGIIAVAKHHGKGKLFEKADFDNDEFVTKEEFLKYKTEKFDSMDADKDGKISKDELKSYKKSKKIKKLKEKLEKLESGDAEN